MHQILSLRNENLFLSLKQSQRKLSVFPLSALPASGRFATPKKFGPEFSNVHTNAVTTRPRFQKLNRRSEVRHIMTSSQVSIMCRNSFFSAFSPTSIFPLISFLKRHLGSSCLFAPLYAHALIARFLLFSLCGQAQLGTPTLDVLAGEPAGDSIGRVLW